MNTTLLVLLAGTVALVSGCTANPEVRAAQIEKRQQIFKDCLGRIPPGPQTTHYNDWDEVVSKCDSVAYYQSAEYDPRYVKPSKPDKSVGDMCEQRDALLEEGLVDKFDAYVCIRPQEP